MLWHISVFRWVPTKGGLKPAQLRNTHHSNTVTVMRNSIVSQNSATGKLETSIISEEAVFGGDSGSISDALAARAESEKIIARLVASLSLPGEPALPSLSSQ